MHVEAQTTYGYALRLAGANTSPTPVVTRTQGPDRYATASAISERFFPTSNTVFIATGENYPDVLTAAPAAGRNDAPILYVRSNGIPASTLHEIGRLNPQQIVIVGGTDAVSLEVEAQLRDTVPNVARYAGADRYATAAAISRNTFIEDVDTVYIATRENYVDALAAGPAAISEEAPLLLTEPDRLPAPVSRELLRLNPARIIIIGGLDAVSRSVEMQLINYAKTVERYGGVSCWETAQRISEEAFTADTAHTAYVVYGKGWADDAAGSAPHAGCRDPYF